MLKESNNIQIDTLEHYDSIENLLNALNKLSIKSAGPVLKDFKNDLRSDFYCSDCDSTREDCYGHDDYPDYHADDYDDERETEDKPAEEKKV